MAKEFAKKAKTKVTMSKHRTLREKFDMAEKQFTEAQVLCGINEIWRGITGSKSSQNLQESIFISLNSKSFFADPDIGLEDVVLEIEEYFRFAANRSEWETFFEDDVAKVDPKTWETVSAQKITFAALARFINDRIQFVSVAPAVVAGRLCGPAGVFYGMEKIVADVSPREVRFTPSTKIRDALPRRTLDELWRQLHWMTGASLPSLPEGHRMLGCLAILVLIGAGIGAFFVGEWFVLAIGVLLAAFCFSVAAICEYWIDPLPKHIKTFRDLAVIISKLDCDATRGNA